MFFKYNYFLSEQLHNSSLLWRLPAVLRELFKIEKPVQLRTPTVFELGVKIFAWDSGVYLANDKRSGKCYLCFIIFLNKIVEDFKFEYTLNRTEQMIIIWVNTWTLSSKYTKLN